MRATAPLLASALLSVSLATHHVHHPRDAIVARDSIKPTYVCGDGAVDCNDGFCCKSGQVCVSYQNIPACQVAGVDTLADAYPYDSTALSTAQAALSSYLATAYPASTSSASSSAAAASSTPIYGYGNATSSLSPTGTGASSSLSPYSTSSATGSAPSPTFTGAASTLEVGMGLVIGLLGIGWVL